MTFGGHILIVVVTAILAATGYDIIPTTALNDTTLNIRNSDDYLRHMAWMNRFEDGTVMWRGFVKEVQNRTQVETVYCFFCIGDVVNYGFMIG